MELLRQEDVDADRVVEIINYDAALTTAVLRACNTVAYAGATRVTDLNQALLRVGFRNVFQIATVVSGAAVFQAQPANAGLNPAELWAHSVASAVAAELIAQDLGDDPSTAFTAGLVHDIGKLVLSEAMGPLYANVVVETEQHHRSWRETEKLLLGVEHAEVGGRLLGHWKFPELLVDAVWFHHAPARAHPHVRLASIIHLANTVAHSLGFNAGLQPFAQTPKADILTTLNLDPEQWPIYLVRTSEKLQTIEALLNLKP